MGVIKRAVSKLIEIFQYAVMSSAQSDKLPENRRVGRTPDSFFNLPRFGNAAIGNEHHVYRQGAVSKIINYLFHHRRFVIRTAQPGQIFPGGTFAGALNGLNIAIKIIQRDIRVFFMSFGKTPYIHRPVVIKLRCQYGDTIQHRLHLAFRELTFHGAGCVQNKRHSGIDGVELMFTQADRCLFCQTDQPGRF